MNITTIKSTSENNYVEYTCNNLFQKLGSYTFGLDKIIPWEEKNFVFAGGLLNDIINERFDQNLMDIDLFFYGNSVSKTKTINKLLDNLDKDQYYYLIGYNKSVIYIFIQGIPRIIQLIMTNKTNPEQIINSFDLTHLMTYFDGTKIYSNPIAIQQLNTKETTTNKVVNKYRIIKYFERGINCNNLLFENYNFVITHGETKKILDYHKQRKLYDFTLNLTKNPHDFSSQINFKKIDRDVISFNDYFNCFVNYNKLDNHDFKENVDMFGAFSNYMGLNRIVLSGFKTLNETDSNNLNKNVNPLINDEITKISKTLFGKLYTFENNSSIYTPCKFVKTETTTTDVKKPYNYNPAVDNYNTSSKIVKIFLELDKIEVINYIKKLIENIEKIEFDYKKSISNINKNKILLGFLENDKEENKMTICAILRDVSIDTFENINGLIINNLVQGQEIYCLLNFTMYLKLYNVNFHYDDENIEYIDFNLCPLYIKT